MGQKADIRLDVLIIKEEDHYLAHCLQFDLVTTNDSLESVKQDMIDLCRAHIENSYAYDNLEYLFSPAPKEVWKAYLEASTKEGCSVENKTLDDSLHLNPFSVQEIYCHA